MSARKRLQAEKDLDWFFNVFPSCVGLAAMDPSAGISTCRSEGYTDHQLDSINRSLPIHQTLILCTSKTRKVLELVFTARAWRTEHCNGRSDHYDLELVFGKLTGIVKHYRLAGEKSEIRLVASGFLEKALKEYVSKLRG